MASKKQDPRHFFGKVIRPKVDILNFLGQQSLETPGYQIEMGIIFNLTQIDKATTKLDQYGSRLGI
jgi:hypothetical protein